MDRSHKRRRLSPDTDLNVIRARNDARLKTAFESIFEKYGRDFSGVGDEIDLETGEIVVNNGHLLGMIDEKHMFDVPDTKRGSDELKVGDKAGCQSDQPTEVPQKPAYGTNSEASWLSDDADSLMGDVVLKCSPMVKGNGGQELRLPDIHSKSRYSGLPSSAMPNGRSRPSAVGRLKAKPHHVMPRWTEQEDNLLLCLWSDTTLRYTEVKEHFKEHFPHRSFKAIQNHWCKKRQKSLWKRSSRDRITKSSTVRHSACETNLTEYSRTLDEDQQLRSRDGNESSPDVLINNFCVEARTTTRGGKSKPNEVRRAGPDVHQEHSPAEVPEFGANFGINRLSQNRQEHASLLSAGTSTGTECLTQNLQEYGHPLSGVSTSSTRKQRIPVHVADKVPRPLVVKRLDNSCEDTVAKYSQHVLSKSKVIPKRPDPAKLFNRQEGKAQGKNHNVLNIAAIAKAEPTEPQCVQRITSCITRPGNEGHGSSAMSRDDVQMPPIFRNRARSGQLQSAAATRALTDTYRTTLSQPQASSTGYKYSPIDRKTHPRTLLCLSAKHNFTPISNVPPFPKIGLPPGAQNPLGPTGPSDDARREGIKSVAGAGQAARKKPLGVPRKASSAVTLTLDQRPPNQNPRAEETSRAIGSSPPAETSSPILRSHLPTSTQSQKKRHVEGLGLASARTFSSHNMDLSDDELSTPIRTVGTPSASKAVLPVAGQRRKTLH